MSKSLFIILCVCCVCCKSKPITENKVIEKSNLEIIPAESKSYDDTKNEIGKIKDSLRMQWQQLSLAEKSKHFSNIIIKKIVPYWYSTKWDFNGTSRIPIQGSIACGYFVTTILHDAGLNLARNRLAQCASEQMIRELVNKRYIHQFRNVKMIDFISEIKTEGTGTFLIGLDNHTGFIYNDGDTIYFIHSSYINSIGVIKEKAAESSILFYSKYKITGKISEDEKLLDN
jgi:hypothetical protein